MVARLLLKNWSWREKEVDFWFCFWAQFYLNLFKGLIHKVAFFMSF